MEKVLLTGASGFIGRNILKCYPRRIGVDGPEFVTLDTQDSADVVHDLMEPILSPITEDDSKFTTIFHLAAKTSVRDFEQSVGANEKILNNVLDWATRNKVHRLVFASSSSVYGNSHSMKEDSVCLPISEYGISKLVCEQIITEWCNRTNSTAISLRLFNVMGQYQRPNMLPSLICSQMRNGGPPIEIYGTRFRNWTYVGDVVWAFYESCRLSSEMTPKTNLVLNMGGTSGVISQTQLIQLFNSITGLPVRVNPAPPNSLDVSKTQADMTLFKKTFDWAPHSSNLLKSVVEVATDYGLYSSHN